MSMFSELFNLGHTRTVLQAVAFYFVYLLLLTALAAVVGVVTAYVTGVSEGGRYTFAVQAGVIVMIVLCTLIASLIAQKKGIIKDPLNMILIILTAAFSAAGAGILGLIIPAYLSTRPQGGSAAAGDPIAADGFNTSENL